MFFSFKGIASISIPNQIRVNAARLDLCTEQFRVFWFACFAVGNGDRAIFDVRML